MSAARRKGTFAETLVVAYLRHHGFPHAERAPLHGQADQGDIAGCVGLAFEVRNRHRLNLPAWLRDAADRREARGAELGLLVIKPVGLGATHVEDWAVVLRLAEAVHLLRAAGYGTPDPHDPAGAAEEQAA